MTDRDIHDSLSAQIAEVRAMIVEHHDEFDKRSRDNADSNRRTAKFLRRAIIVFGVCFSLLGGYTYNRIQDSRADATRDACRRENSKNAALRSLFVNFVPAEGLKLRKVKLYLKSHRKDFPVTGLFPQPARRPGQAAPDPDTLVAYLTYVDGIFPRINCEQRVQDTVK